MLSKLIYYVSELIKGNIIADFGMTGQIGQDAFKIPRFSNYIRIKTFELLAREIKNNHISGNLAEVGVFKGRFARYMNQAFPERITYLFDTFNGFDAKDVEEEVKQKFSEGNQDFSNTTVQKVLNLMPFPDRCKIMKGWFPESLEGLEDKFCFVSLDPDLYKPIFAGLEYFYPRLNQGGFIMIHDYNNDFYPGAKKAVAEFSKLYGVSHVPICDQWGSTVIVKSTQ